MVINLPSDDTEYFCPVLSLQYSQIFIVVTVGAKSPMPYTHATSKSQVILVERRGMSRVTGVSIYPSL